MVGYTIGAIFFVAMLAFLFVPSLLEIADQISKRFKARKKAGVPTGYPGA